MCVRSPQATPPSLRDSRNSSAIVPHELPLQVTKGVTARAGGGL